MPKDERPRQSPVPMIRLVKPDGPDDLRRVVILVSNDNGTEDRPVPPFPEPRY